MALNSISDFLNIVKDNVSINSVGLQKQLAVDYVQVIARDTPVDTGRATANWLAGINRAPRGGLSIFDKSATANPTANRARKDLSRLKFGDEVIIRNAVEDESDDPQGYILKLEMGSSPQARTGMFRKNVTRYKQMVRLSKKKIGL